MSLILLLLLPFDVLAATVVPDVCEDYTPCSCQQYDPYGLIVRCGDSFDPNSSITSLDVHNIFNRTEALHVFWVDIFSLSPEVDSDDSIRIPADVLSEKRVDRLGISCSTFVGHLILEIHPDAFRSSIHQIGHFEMAGCDFSRLNFKFLADTTSLVSLSIGPGLNFRGFPPLPFLARVTSLRIYNYLDFRHWNQIADRFPLLESLFLDGTQLGDRLINKLVSSIASSPTGRHSLTQLSLWENKLSRVPEHISSFKNLSYVNLFGNAIRFLARGSFAFNPKIKVTFLILIRNALERIEPGAFQGDFSEAIIYLDYNHLSRFDSAVYQKLLEQMQSVSSAAGIHLRNNPFECGDCHLAWLIRDKPHLLTRVFGGRCSNGTQFEDLKPEGYHDCL
ncbi:uncharacterized protein LOC130696745 [Daphnia carinata]|uniref:uncharacterized protein LOC130696745 n=1 Tax=Daphnia carinata TaxID=120202 RepID=UPI0028686478|nr:uncharacterized protein LOC130696745 [Daphnia carinata]